MCIVPVKVKKDHSSEAVETYALLDSCSQGTFISEKLTQDLGASGRKTSITVKTLNGEHTSTSMVIEGLQVAQVDDTLNKWLTLPRTFAKSELPVDSDDVTNPCELKKWKYLDHIINQLKWKENPDVGLLIGANCTKALEPIEMIQSRNGGSYAFRMQLGWSLYTNVLIGNPTNKNIIHTQDDQQLTQIRKDENIQSITTPCTDKKNTTTKSETVRLSEGIGDMLYRLVKEQSAPDVDMETFDGNPLNYTYFRCMFRETVEKKIDDPQGRLTRLIKYTSGEAQEMVKHFIHDRPDRGYQNAITLLEKNYGNPYKILASYRNEIKRMPKIRTGDASAYRKMFNFLIKCKSLSYDEGYNPLDTPDVICMVLAKLPIYLQDRWNRDAMKIRRIRCREPGLTELLNFIEEEMMLVSDPLFSREAISQYEEKTHLSKPQKLHGNKFHSFATGRGSEDDEDQNEAAKLSCAICGEDHDIEYCDEFLNQSVQERSKIIFRRKLCYGCLTDISKDHNAKNCSNRRKCMVCNGTHPTTIHGVKIEKKRKMNKEMKIIKI